MQQLRTLHRLSGAVLALLLALIALTGAVSAFRGDIVRLTLPAARGAAADPAGFGAALDAAQAAGLAIRNAKLAPYGLAVHRVWLADGSSAFVDAQGAAVQQWKATPRFEEWVLQLHHKFLLGETGETVVGIIGVAATGMLVSGLILYWPARRGFSWRLWPTTGQRRDLVKSHRNIGLLLALPLAFQFITGATMVFERPLRNALAITPAPAPDIAQTGPVAWAATLATVQAAYPQAALREASAPRKPGKPASVRIQQPGDLNPEGATQVFVADGKIVGVNQPGTGPRGWFDSQLGVHTMGYIGAGSRFALAALGLMLAAMVLLGGLSWLRGQRRTT